MAWEEIGTVTVSPDDDEVVVGPIQVPTFNGLPVRVQLLGGPYSFQFGYGLLSYSSSRGKELGTVRVWPKTEAETYLLGQGLTVSDNTGVLKFRARTWNLRWVEAGFPLTLRVWADLAGDLPPAVPYVSPGFSDGLTDLTLTVLGQLARLTFLP